ncbi:hypothetical protein D3C72_1976950 [compost metagenome]
MALIAHVQRLSQHQAQVDLTGQLHGVAQHRAEHVAHPVQAVNDALIVGTHAQDLRHLLAQIGISAIAVGLVLDDVHEHGGGGHPCHGADTVVLVAR